ncbi:hypothetical protein HY485_00320 [Candidatus Woesearchaeota archaeon]|nr:hypothetical protein [Candidatus Woesearchaeota archaeon]
MADIADLVNIFQTVNDKLVDVEASKSTTDAEVKEAHARLNVWYAERQAVDAALKTAAGEFSPQFRLTYAAELSDPVNAIPFLKDVVDDFEQLYAGADTQRQRFEKAFGNAHLKYHDARGRIERLKDAVSFLNKETGKLEKAKAGLGSVVRFLNEQNDDLTAHNQRLEDAVAYLNNEAQQLSGKVAKRDAFIDKRYGVSVDETPESAFVDALKSVYRNLTDGNERAFDECARYVAKGAKGKAFGTKEVVDMVKIVAGYETGKPGWFSKKEDAYAVTREMTALLDGINEDSDVERVFIRLRTGKEKKWPLCRISDYVLSTPFKELAIART